MGTLDTVQQEQLKAIGTYLSDVRQEQARSLEEIAAKTYIPLRLLKAIETGQEKPLPEPVFIQGFIRRYADALGLDGIDLSQKFPVHVTPLPTPAATATSREPRLRSAVEPSYTAAPVEEYGLPRRSQPPARSNFLPYGIAAGLLVLGGIALGIVRSISSQQTEVSPPSSVVLPQQPVLPTAQASPSASPQAAAPKPAVSPSAAVRSASPSPTASTSPTAQAPAGSNAASNAPVNVALNLTGESWIQVVVDGEVKAEGVLPQGTRQNWAGQREIIIIAGNAGSVSVAQNGAAAKVMGASGDVAEVRFIPKPN